MDNFENFYTRQIIYLPTNISYLRKKFKMNQKDLGTLLHCSDKTISSWELGTKKPDIIDVNTMAKFFKVSLDDMFDIDLRMENPDYLDSVVRNIKSLSKEKQQEIIPIIDVIVKSKMTNLSDEDV